MTTKFKFSNLTFEVAELSRDRVSVVVLGDFDSDELSNLSWPSDEQVSEVVGRPVKYFDGGDNLAEAIYVEVAQ